MSSAPAPSSDPDPDRSAVVPNAARPWPHAPPHWLHSAGLYFVTAGTHQKQRIFDSPAKLDLITHTLLDTAAANGWSLRAWAVLVNLYHFVAASPEGGAETLREWLTDFHRTTATGINRLDVTPGRRVWFQFRDTLLTHQVSYLARLRYTHENAVHHDLVPVARDYRWCSAAWFETNAPASFVASVRRFKTDRVKVWDDFV